MAAVWHFLPGQQTSGTGAALLHFLGHRLEHQIGSSPRINKTGNCSAS